MAVDSRLLPDIDAYLERIGIAQVRPATCEFLDELIQAHQHTVPFEDLDVHDKHAAPSLEIADLFEKIVVRKRGGYCFELNALFNALLRDLGFQTQAAMARVLTRPNPCPVFSHRATIVTVDGRRYLADVGFGGPMPGFASLMVDGASRTEQGQTFTMHELDEYWWEVGYTSANHDDWRVLRLCTMPVEEHDFIPLSFYQSQNPQSAFRMHRIVNIKTARGAYGLRDLTLTEFRDGGQTQREIGEDELDAILEEKFGITGWR